MLKDHKDKIRMFTYAAVDNSEEVQNRTQASYDIDRVILEKMKANLDLNHEFYFFKNNKYHLMQIHFNANEGGFPILFRTTDAHEKLR